MHWILAVLCAKTATVLVLDPMVNEYQPFHKSHQQVVFAASEILNHRFLKQVAKVESIKHTLQKDTNSCGVYYCFYASQVLSSKCKDVPAEIHTAKSMLEYGFSLIRIFPHKDNSVLIWKNKGHQKPVFWQILCSDNEILEKHLNYVVCQLGYKNILNGWS